MLCRLNFEIMKLFTSILTCLITYLTVIDGRPESIEHEKTEDFDLNTSIDLCAAEVGLLIEETRRSFNMPIEAPGNCVMACVWKKIGMMELDGKIVKEEMIREIHPTLQHIPNITKITEADFYHCVDKANEYDGGCIVVSEYFKCLIKDLFLQLAQ